MQPVVYWSSSVGIRFFELILSDVDKRCTMLQVAKIYVSGKDRCDC